MNLKEGYFPLPPNDVFQDIRSEMLLTLGQLGVPIEKHHHEVAAAGQQELGMKFAELISAADNVMTYKYVVRNVARRYGRTATFMPKPVFADNGSGMHVHQSLWKGGNPCSSVWAPTPTSPRRPAGTSAVCSGMPPASWPSPTPPPTATSAWCPASRHL